MKQLTQKEKKRLLVQAFWDQKVEGEALLSVISAPHSRALSRGPDRIQVFVRLLSTYDWYTLLKLIPKSALAEALSEEVLTRLYPKELRENYEYARKRLFG